MIGGTAAAGVGSNFQALWEKDVPMVMLHDLLRALDSSISCHGLPNLEITGVEEDSRKIVPGNLFVARPGTKTDGGKFAADALARGAAAMVTQGADAGVGLPQIVVRDAAGAVARLAHLFYGEPTRQVKLLAVTGTNGKTTSAYLIRHLLNSVGQRCGMIGTVEIDDGRSAVEASMTTPGAVETAAWLAKMREHECGACALEASSHALDQQRLAGAWVAGAAFTNLTGDHLDYHKTMEQYAGAKAKLFEMLDENAPAVVNGDDPFSDRMVRDCRGRVIRFGFKKGADYRARDVLVTARGSKFTLITPDGQANVEMGLIGRHNIENALTAAALAGETFGLSVHQLAAGLRTASGAPGRLSLVPGDHPFAVLVDYAHTDDALENVLSALRPLCRKGKLRVLFGCGGDRDRTKRPRMARTAQKWADAVYVTSDNPRTEEPGAIIEEILSGFSADESMGEKTEGRGKRIVVEVDRRRAIERILSDAQAGDIVLLAGKGHENYQIVGTQKRHFDDGEEARRILEKGNLVR
jgi:UDP-N-acetylmuramoyl-L-alanyl-D-glutamate--2,6-diaminopimelate ligase